MLAVRVYAEHHTLFSSFKDSLESPGDLRAAGMIPLLPRLATNAWVKKGILLGFRLGSIVDMSVDSSKLPFFDKSTYPLHSFPSLTESHFPAAPAFATEAYSPARNLHAAMFVMSVPSFGENTMIDSHALVGSCAQVGGNCHISAGSQIGGVLEPVGALPLLLKMTFLLAEFRNLRRHRRQAPRRPRYGTILNRSIPVYDLVRDTVYSASDDCL